MRAANLLIVSVLIAATARGEIGGDLWSFDGYGTFGIVHSDEDRADYVPT